MAKTTFHDSETKAEGQQVITACAFIYREHQGQIQLFLPRRSSVKKFLPDVFELPGGHIDFGEGLVEGLKREIKEEFGMEIKVEDPFFAFTYLNPIKGSHSVEIIYFAQFADSESKIELNPEDHSEYRWITEEDIPEIIKVNRKSDDDEVLAIKKGFGILKHSS